MTRGNKRVKKKENKKNNENEKKVLTEEEASNKLKVSDTKQNAYVSYMRKEEIQEIKNIFNIEVLNECNLLLGAVALGNFNVVKKLLKQGYQINFRGENGLTPLMWAVKCKRFEMVGLLIKRGADITASNTDGNNAMLLAIQSDEWHQDAFLDLWNTISRFSVNFDGIINHSNQKGYSLLHFAIKRQWENIVDRLLEDGADVNCTNNQGISPLMMAGKKSDMFMIKKLLKYKANILLEDKKGCTAWCYAIASLIPKHLGASNTEIDRLVIELSSLAPSQTSLELYLKRRLDLLVYPLNENFAVTISNVTVHLMTFFTRFNQGGLRLLLELQVFVRIQEAIERHIEDVEYVSALMAVTLELVRVCQCCFNDLLQMEIGRDFVNSGIPETCIRILKKHGQITMNRTVINAAIIPLISVCTSISLSGRLWLQNNYKSFIPLYQNYTKSNDLSFKIIADDFHITLMKRRVDEFQKLLENLELGQTIVENLAAPKPDAKFSEIETHHSLNDMSLIDFLSEKCCPKESRAESKVIDDSLKKLKLDKTDQSSHLKRYNKTVIEPPSNQGELYTSRNNRIEGKQFTLLRRQDNNSASIQSKETSPSPDERMLMAIEKVQFNDSNDINKSNPTKPFQNSRLEEGKTFSSVLQRNLRKETNPLSLLKQDINSMSILDENLENLAAQTRNPQILGGPPNIAVYESNNLNFNSIPSESNYSNEEFDQITQTKINYHTSLFVDELAHLNIDTYFADINIEEINQDPISNFLWNKKIDDSNNIKEEIKSNSISTSEKDDESSSDDEEYGSTNDDDDDDDDNDEDDDDEDNDDSHDEEVYKFDNRFANCNQLGVKGFNSESNFDEGSTTKTELSEDLDGKSFKMQRNHSIDNNGKNDSSIFKQKISNLRENEMDKIQSSIPTAKECPVNELDQQMEKLDKQLKNIINQYEFLWRNDWENGYVKAQGDEKNLLELMTNLPYLELLHLQLFTKKWDEFRQKLSSKTGKNLKSIIKRVEDYLECFSANLDKKIAVCMSVNEQDLSEFEFDLKSNHFYDNGAKFNKESITVENGHDRELNDVVIRNDDIHSSFIGNNKCNNDGIFMTVQNNLNCLSNLNTNSFENNIDGYLSRALKHDGVRSYNYNYNKKNSWTRIADCINSEVTNSEDCKQPTKILKRGEPEIDVSVPIKLNKLPLNPDGDKRHECPINSNRYPEKPLFLDNGDYTFKSKLMNGGQPNYESALIEDRKSMYCSERHLDTIIKFLELDERKREVFGNGTLILAGSSTYPEFKLCDGGNFGAIELGLDQEGFPLAVKRLIRCKTRTMEVISSTLKSLLHDMRNLRHANLVPYVNYIETEYNVMIALPLCERNLEEHIKYLNERDELGNQCSNLVEQILIGLRYLHNQDPPIVHGNLKPTNILIDSKQTLRLADFGLHKILFKQKSPLGDGMIWWAQETYLTYKNTLKVVCTLQSDIQVSGILMHYIITGGLNPLTRQNTLVGEDTHLQVPSLRTIDCEANDLLTWMLDNVSNRPTIYQALSHLCFWSEERKWEYILACSGINSNYEESTLSLREFSTFISRQALKEKSEGNWVPILEENFPQLSQSVFCDTGAGGLLVFINVTILNSGLVLRQKFKKIIFNAFPNLPLCLFRYTEDSEWETHPELIKFSHHCCHSSLSIL